MKKNLISALCLLLCSTVALAQHDFYVIDGHHVENFDGSQLIGKTIKYYEVKRLDNAEKTTIHNIFTEGEWAKGAWEKIEGGPSIKQVVIHDYKDGGWQSVSDDSIPGAKYRSVTKVRTMTRDQADSLGLSLVTNYVPVAMRNPLVILDGEEYYGKINGINVLDIDHIDIYKPGSTEAKDYGDKGKHGVMKVFTKKQADVITYIVNGNPATKSEFDRLSRSDIKEIKILKRGTAVAMKASADGKTHDVYLVTTNK
jgi:hypothetical protein